MKRWNKWAGVLTAAALVAGLLAGCAAAEGPGGETATRDATSASDKVKAEDLDASWDEATATKISFEGESISVDGQGAAADGSTLTITAAGTYLLSGTLADGQVVVEAPDDALVRLVLNGVSLHCGTSAPVNCVTADKLLVILAEGTENEITDGAVYAFPDETTDEPSAALFSKQDLTINGTGALAVTANYNNGIGTKDDLIIVSGEIRVTAANHAVRGRDSVTVLDGGLTLDAGGDGIQTNNDTGEADKGWMELYGGSYDITAANDGIQAETTLAVYGGEYDIVSGGGSVNAPERAAEMMGPGGGGFPGGTPPEGMELPEGMTPPEDGAIPEFEAGMTPPEGVPEDGTVPTPPGGSADGGAAGEAAPTGESQPADSATGSTGDAGAETATEETVSDSFKGIKSGGNMSITGGSFTLDSADDTLHTNANMTIGGGSFALSSGDDAAHADGDLLVEGEPVIDIATCYEGLEGTHVTVNGGDITVNATDDGLNAAGGSDDTNTGIFGADQFSGGGDYSITIGGGTLHITAGFDGLDSNGSITISGGETYVSGSTTGGGEGAIDCDGTVTVTGGVLAGAGTSSFVVMGAGGGSINADGSQPVLNFQFSSAREAETVIELKDGGGNTLVTFTAEKPFTQIALSAPELRDGESYTVCADGEEISTVTLSGMMTSVSDTGESVDTAMGGPGGQGGMGGRPGG